MAASLDMFGAGGEALGGLFMGNQMAMQRDQAALEQQKALADIAGQQAMTQQRQLTNQYDEAILGDRISQFKQAAQQKTEDAAIEKYNRQGEQFGRMSQELKAMPAAARQARLRQIAQQQGIGEDNPMLQQFLTVDPEQLPDMMGTFSQGFYEQSDKARAEKMKRDEMMKLEREKIAGKAEEGRLNREQKAELAREGFGLRRDIAAMTQAGQDRRAGERAAAKGKGGPVDVMGAVAAGKLTPQKAITYYEMKEATEGELSEGERQAKENLQRLVLSMPTMGKADTSSITGLPSAQARVDAAIRGDKAAPAAGAAEKQTKAAPAGGGDIASAAKAMGIPYEPDKYDYRIENGRLKRNPKSQAVPK